MSRLAIIPARGGSKRIPRKNIKDFLGKPIITYSIEAALQAELFDEVMVSTDDEEIATISRQAGAEVPFLRSAANANDYATTADVLAEVIDRYADQGKTFESACCLYPTAPFVTALKLKESLTLFEANGFKTLFPVAAHSHPIQRSLRLNDKGQASMFYPEYLNTRSQDLETAYYDAGQFYWFRPDILNKERKLWTDYSGVVVYNDMEVQDIDNENDWALAEMKFQLLNKKL